MKLKSILLSLLLALAAPSTVSWAQPSEVDRSAARALGQEGITLYRAGDYETALDRLSRAHDIVGLTTTGLWRARCLVALGRVVEASEQYLDVTRMTLPDDAREVHITAVDEAAKEREALMKVIAHVQLSSDSELAADVAITIDDKPVPRALIGAKRPIDPGQHTLTVARGDWRKQQSFTVAEGADLKLTIPTPPEPTVGAQPEPVAPPPASTTGTDEDEGSVLPTVGWITFSVGAAGLTMGVVTGILALDKQRVLEAGCDSDGCGPSLHGDVDDFELFRALSTAGIIAGAALAVGGLTMVLLAPSESEPTSAKLMFRPGSADLSVSF